VLELIFTRDSASNTKDRALLIISAIAAIVIGVGMMVWVFAGAVLVSAVVGIAAAARGVSLVLSGIPSDAANSAERENRRYGQLPE
jgi:uncharacterized membrane protein HdeD (DUF308 family)